LNELFKKGLFALVSITALRRNNETKKCFEQKEFDLNLFHRTCGEEYAQQDLFTIRNTKIEEPRIVQFLVSGFEKRV